MFTNSPRCADRIAVAVFTCGVWIGTGSPALGQASYSAVKDLTGTGAVQPRGGVIEGPDGAFYGTSYQSTQGCGAVYRVTNAGGFAVLHEFLLSEKLGCRPTGELVLGSDGNFYGTAMEGGPNTDGVVAGQGTGTVFRVTPSGVVTVVHAFAPYSSAISGYPEGIRPMGGLTVGSDGALYGVTNYGGPSSPGGTVFRVTTGGGFSVIGSLDASTGTYPNSGLTLGPDGNLYGTGTQGASTFNGGGVFRVTPAGVSLVFALPIDSGCGCWKFGYSPIGKVAFDAAGTMYGTSYLGGAGAPSTQQGVLWKWSASSGLTLVHQFTGSDGHAYWGGLTTAADGSMYGASTSFVASTAVAFRIAPGGAFTPIYTFDPGLLVEGPLLESDPGTLLGVSSSGGTNGVGLVFRLSLTAPNLQVSGISAPAATASGAAITVKDTTKNAGTGSAPPTTTRLWLSLNKTLDGGDVPLADRGVPNLVAGTKNAGPLLITIPATPPGKYFLLAQADANAVAAETSESDNVKAKSLLIGPDLVINSVTFTPATLTASTPTTISWIVKNAGGATAGASVTRLYRSANGKLEKALDTLLGSLPLAALAPGATQTQGTSVVVPAGTYYILLVADDGGTVVEANETNNLKKVQKTVGP